MMTDQLSRSFVHDFLNRQKQTYIPTLKETLLQSILHVCSCATTLFSFPGCFQGLLQADGCTTASSKKSKNTQPNWFGKPEHVFKISFMWVLIVVKYGLLSRTISTLHCRDFYCRNYAKQIDFAGSFAIYVLTGVRNKCQGYESG